MSKEELQGMHEFRSDKLMRGQWSKPPIKPCRTEETRKRLDDAKEAQDLKERIGKEYWED